MNPNMLWLRLKGMDGEAGQRHASLPRMPPVTLRKAQLGCQGRKEHTEHQFREVGSASARSRLGSIWASLGFPMSRAWKDKRFRKYRRDS